MAQARQAPAGSAQAQRLVAGIRQRHAVAETAMVMMILRAVLVMIGIARMPVIVIRVALHGSNDLTWIDREGTCLHPGAYAKQQ